MFFNAKSGFVVEILCKHNKHGDVPIVNVTVDITKRKELDMSNLPTFSATE